MIAEWALARQCIWVSYCPCWRRKAKALVRMVFRKGEGKRMTNMCGTNVPLCQWIVSLSHFIESIVMKCYECFLLANLQNMPLLSPLQKYQKMMTLPNSHHKITSIPSAEPGRPSVVAAPCMQTRVAVALPAPRTAHPPYLFRSLARPGWWNRWCLEVCKGRRTIKASWKRYHKKATSRNPESKNGEKKKKNMKNKVLQGLGQGTWHANGPR